MDRWDKGPAIVMGPDEGDSYWQPEPAYGHVTLKLTPYNCPSNRFTLALQTLPPGGVLPEHAHERAEELLYVLRGNATAIVDGERHASPAGTTIWAGRWVTHSFINEGDENLELLAMIFPPGLEDFLAGIGTPRRTGQPRPESVEYPENLGELLERVRFATPDRLVDTDGQTVEHPDKGPALVVGPDEGDSYWQPSPAVGYATTKISPYTFPGNFVTMGVQVLEPGAVLPEHAHQRNEEMKFIVRGHGRAVIDGVEHRVGPGSLAFTGRWVTHTYVNDGDEDMAILYVFSPPILEDLLSAMGRSRMPGDLPPAPFDPPADILELLARTRLALPEEARTGESAAPTLRATRG